ncbi:site-specific integrase [Spartinivicinus poritis]|uniref:Site-specific integrase n=1 Tax=Spartinivicinus poritis TaxID=2994640 RepID=A0ABT5UFK4_9GAMM|nr:site-specific integrase [Spartinivicinus sp. A2-2]MDE1464761.1 site-specific integrase [Spartinivicinus sp. A2-2]
MGSVAAVKYRNYISVCIMLYCGLRPGELLSLKVEDVQIGSISSLRVVRRPPDPSDARKPRPQIKRNGRVLPINSREFVRCLNEYIVKWRDILELNSSQETDYLILSDEGQPLSYATLTQLFNRLRAKYPKNLPSHLTPKALRHTFSARMERALRVAGLDEGRRSQALALLRGDSSLESQSVYIAQEIEEIANKALVSYQKGLVKGDLI